eukprot:662734-Prymnesium_polylepis.2
MSLRVRCEGHCIPINCRGHRDTVVAWLLALCWRGCSRLGSQRCGSQLLAAREICVCGWGAYACLLRHCGLDACRHRHPSRRVPASASALVTRVPVPPGGPRRWL